jgi:hypothetical protein
MIKQLFIIALYMMPIFAMQSENGSYIVSQKCHDDIQEILRDREVLFYSFNQAFEHLSKNQIPIIKKPSDCITVLEQEPNIDDEVQLEYAALTWYLKNIIRPCCGSLDEAFDMQQVTLHDESKTWAWFNHYFKNEGLRKPIASYCNQLIKKDQALHRPKKTTKPKKKIR